MAKILSVLVLPTVLVLLVTGNLPSKEPCGISKHEFWVVDLARSEKVSVRVGDLILLKTPTYPVIPANLKKTFGVDFNRERLRLVTEEPPENDGRMGKRYYFVVKQAGATEVRFIVRQEEREVESFRLSIYAQN